MKTILAVSILSLFGNWTPINSGTLVFSKDQRVQVALTIKAEKKMKIRVEASGYNPFRIGAISNLPNGRMGTDKFEQSPCSTTKPKDEASFECELPRGQFILLVENSLPRDNQIRFRLLQVTAP